jgi:hypothetical protein
MLSRKSRSKESDNDREKKINEQQMARLCLLQPRPYWKEIGEKMDGEDTPVSICRLLRDKTELVLYWRGPRRHWTGILHDSFLRAI